MRILILSLVFFLGACGSQKPVPVDHFYRLPSIDAGSVDDVTLSDGVIYVANFQTDGLHLERAMVHTENSQGLELSQYHYKHWIDSPTRLIRDHLVMYLRAISAAPVIVTTVDPYPQLEVTGKIHRFDQVVGGGNSEVVVSLELRADEGGKLVHLQDYTLTEPVNGDGVEDTVSAFNQALLSCFSQFVNEVKAAL